MESNPTGGEAVVRQESRPTEEPPTQAAPSEWEAFFGPKAPSASAFLKALRTQTFHAPSEAELGKVADLIVAGKSGFARLLSLLQALGQERDSVHDLAIKLAELSLRRYGLLGPREVEGNRTVTEVVREWLGKTSKARLSPVQRDALLAFVLIRRRTGGLSESQALEVLNLVVFLRSGKKRPKADVLAPPRPMEVLLRIATGKANLKGLLELSNAWRHQETELDAARRLAESAREEAASGRDRLQQVVDQLQQEMEQLRGVQAALELRIQELESHNRDLRTDFQHRLDEMRGRLQGALEGDLSRWLQTAYEASAAEPPRVKVIQERLEMALAGIRRQVEWLRTSG